MQISSCHFVILALVKVVACLLLSPLASKGTAKEVLDFNRDVRPILSSKCFACHGPDEESRATELRLDEPHSSLSVIVPGDAEQSEFYQRITAQEIDLRMPPVGSHKVLKPQEIETLRVWIEEGAQYMELWSLVPPRRGDLPKVRRSEWAKSSIDQFVLHRMEVNNLSPSPAASADVLLRRLWLDLIGLPPLPKDVQAFEEQVARLGMDRAYEEQVDSLLARPEYGEKWAMHWLDLARYADTNGYEKDEPRSIWAFRDWVVNALNQDMPFDKFTIHQIAGDLIPDASEESRIATGFHRNTMLNAEGGIDPLEYRFRAITDRVATTGTTWLGLTLGCAQCHTHKYDPITHREYYEIMAFLNNADEPEMELAAPQLDEQVRQNLARAKQLIDELPNKWPQTTDSEGTSPALRARREFDRWLVAERAARVDWVRLAPQEMQSTLPTVTALDDDSVLASGDTTKDDVITVVYQLPSTDVTAFRLEALPHPSLPGGGPGMTYYEGTKGDFFLRDLRIEVNRSAVTVSKATESYAKNKYQHEVSAQLAVDDDPHTGWSIEGGSGKRHTAIFHLAEPIQGPTTVEVTLSFGRHFASTLGRFRFSYTSAPNPGKALAQPPEVEQALAVSPDKTTPEQMRALWEYFLLTAPELKDSAAEVLELREPPERATSLVMQERPANAPRTTFIHNRGEFLQPTDPVTPGVPRVLHKFNQHWPRTRLGFAYWLVSPENAITPRVVVNRQWAALFGAGVVRTVDDFGVLADPPSHPELLDWLAVEFVDSGWSLKHMHKLMVMSATYRQSSAVSVEHLERDPENRWLARAARPRLAGELVRDAALHASGILSSKMGGPGVRPPQPSGVTEVVFGNLTWEASSGEDRYRRSLYTFKKRVAPFAMYEIFDSPSGEFCTARRQISNTPMQALTLLNDAMILEAAQHLGRRVANRSGDDPERANYAFRRVLVRPPSDAELRDICEFIEAQRRRISEETLNTAAIAGAPANASEVAVWTTLARALLSLDEFLTRN
ncbi:PSD1 and planctomycete cytochrome C domain-containing protein [Aeoliella sp. SH292]|uniref:PSD1 and planctomycete cytochrome C domain-containing protein n=1 Tax=Aeoliella sp. SH292 TaxID=3454464 RepID=UPI003F98E456